MMPNEQENRFQGRDIKAISGLIGKFTVDDASIQEGQSEY